MNLIADAWGWLTTSASWTQPGGVRDRLLEHLAVTGVVVGLTVLLVVPLGVAIGHRRSGGELVIGLAGAARAVPTLGLLTLLALQLGIGLAAPVLALAVLAAPSVLAGAYAGVASVDTELVGAARAIGMSEGQVLRLVELPLAAPIIVGGLRSATLQVIATATLAAYTADAGLGRFIFTGLKSRDYTQMIAGAVLVAALALVIDGLFALTHHLLTRRTGRRADTKGPA